MLTKLLCFVLMATSVSCQNFKNEYNGTLDDFVESFFTNNTNEIILDNPFSPTINPFQRQRITTTVSTLRTIRPSTTTTAPTRRRIPTTFPTNAPEQECIGGTCLPYYLCNNTYGESVIDFRFLEENECHYLEVCCPDENIMENAITISPRVRKGCGYSNIGANSGLRLTETDHESQYGEFPWMVAILYKVWSNSIALSVYNCGGALIHPKVVITAAHCVNNKTHNEIKVRVGEWDTQTKNELFSHQDRNVSEIIIHESYRIFGLLNDIALLILDNEVDLGENIETLCLPPQNMVFDRNRCMVSGWGKNSFGREGQYQVIMKKLELPIVPREECLSVLRSTRLRRRFHLHDSFICAGGEAGTDTCKGDGGSPLVCPIQGITDRYYQAGIVSWGIGCGTEQVPGVYVNIPKFRNWIDMKFNSKGLDMSFYTP